MMQENEQDNSELEISLGDIWESIKKHLLLIIIIAVISTVGGYAVSRFLIAPQYLSTTKLYVEVKTSGTDNVGAELSALNFAQKIANTYTELFKTTTFLEKIAADSGGQIGITDLQNMIKVVVVGDTEILNASVNSDNPELAYKIAQSIERLAPLEMNKIKKNATLNVIDPPVQPTHQISPNILLNTMIAGLAGLFLAIALAIVVDMLSVRIRTEEDIKKKTSLKILAVIPKL